MSWGSDDPWDSDDAQENADFDAHTYSAEGVAAMQNMHVNGHGNSSAGVNNGSSVYGSVQADAMHLRGGQESDDNHNDDCDLDGMTSCDTDPWNSRPDSDSDSRGPRIYVEDDPRSARYKSTTNSTKSHGPKDQEPKRKKR